MQNLLRFFYVYRAFFIFLLLETYCLYHIVTNKSYHKSTYLNATQAWSSGIYTFFDDLSQYLNLSNENNNLAEENAILRKHLEAFLSVDELPMGLVTDSLLQNKFEVIPAKVINNPVNLIDNYFTINKGKEDGVKERMGVITNKGVVGVVKDVSEHFSIAMSLMNTQLRVPAKIKGQYQFGYVQWNGDNINETQLWNISNYLDVKKGDTVTSTSSSHKFPENTKIGVVKDIVSVKGKPYYDINVILTNDIQQLHYVYLIENKFKKEQKKLEKNYFNDAGTDQ